MSAIEMLAGPVARPRLRSRLSVSPSLVLFMSVFTSQAAVLVLSPILVEVARDLDVSTAVAGQLRVFAAPLAAVVAVLVLRSARRFPLRTLLCAGTALVAVGSLGSAAAPSFVVLALAQVPMWIGVAVLVTGGIGAAGSWSAPEGRSRVVARALAGAPAAWIVGMPVIGLVADVSWRLAFLAVPLPAALATGVVLLVASPPERARPQEKPSLSRLLRLPGTRGWALGELLAMSSWAGMLVFSGALFVEVHGASTRLTGAMLATVALAYLGGNALGGRIDHECFRRPLARANAAAGALVALTWVMTPNVFVTLGLFSLAAVVVGARTVFGTSYGFALAGDRKLEVGAARSVTTHAGYLFGSFVGGVALAAGGPTAVGIAFGMLFLGATVPYLAAWTTRNRQGRVLGIFGSACEPQTA